MSLTRRRLFQRIAVGDNSHEWITARGREAAVAEGSLEFGQRAASSGSNSNVIRIASNENPVGPGQHVLDTIVGKFPEANRYPFNAQQREPVLVDAIAKKFEVAADQVVLGTGSGEILTNAVRAFTSPSKPLATPWPRSEEHTSELQSLAYLVCRLLLEKKKKNLIINKTKKKKKKQKKEQHI